MFYCIGIMIDTNVLWQCKYELQLNCINNGNQQRDQEHMPQLATITMINNKHLKINKYYNYQYNLYITHESMEV